jgi:hypothetical protein
MGVGTVDLSFPRKQLKMKYAAHWRYRSSVGGSSLSLLKMSASYRTLTEGSLVPSIASESSRPKISIASGPNIGSLGGALPKTNAQDGTPVYGKHRHLTGAKVEGPGVMKEPLHKTPH